MAHFINDATADKNNRMDFKVYRVLLFSSVAGKCYKTDSEALYMVIHTMKGTQGKEIIFPQPNKARVSLTDDELAERPTQKRQTKAGYSNTDRTRNPG